MVKSLSISRLQHHPQERRDWSLLVAIGIALWAAMSAILSAAR